MQLLMLADEDKSEHKEAIYNLRAAKFEAFERGVRSEQIQAYCIHLLRVEVNQDGSVLSREEVDARADCKERWRRHVTPDDAGPVKVGSSVITIQFVTFRPSNPGWLFTASLSS